LLGDLIKESAPPPTHTQKKEGKKKKMVTFMYWLTNFSHCRLSRKKRVDESQTLTLDFIRHSLIQQEDSIIFSLLERSQFCYNADTYDCDAFHKDGFHGSLVEFMVRETEKLHAQVISVQKRKIII
jgi:hypothetical protein